MIAVNTSYQLAPWADVLYACDHPWWRRYFPEVAATFKGELWTVSEGARDEFDLRWVFGTDNAGLCPDPDRIHTGKNSGYQAIHLAALFGARGIILLGYDFCVGERGQTHWHGDHPQGLSQGGHRRYAVWMDAMKPLAVDLKAAGVKVLNASRRTALKCFQRITLENAFHELRNFDGTGNPGGLRGDVDSALR